MKRKILYISFAAIFLFLLSCKKFLQIEPLDRVPASQLFSDISGVKVVLATLYNKMPIEDFSYNPSVSFNYHGGNGSAGWVDLGWSISCFTDESLLTHGSGAGPVNDGYWDYGAVRQVNQFVEALPTVAMDDAQRNRLRSEAHFIRAYIYFGLAKRYGGVPIISKVQKSNGGNDTTLFVPRSTEKDTWNFILKECDSAVQFLPQSLTAQEGTYRATKWAAYALKSRVALFAASVAKYWNNAPLTGIAVDQKLVGGMTSADADNFYTQCLDASKQIIDNSGKQLYKPTPANPAEAAKNYQDIFQSPSTADIEVIFKKGYIDGTTTRLQGHCTDVYFNPAQTNGGYIAYGRFSPALDLVDLYEDYTDDGTGKSATLVTRTDGIENDYVTSATTMDITKPYKSYTNLADIFANKDARLAGSIIVPGAIWKGVTIIMQGGLIKQDGSTLIFSDGNAPGKDGKTYYTYGANSLTGYSGFRGMGVFDNANFSCTGFSLKKFLQEGKNVQGVQFSSTTDYIDFRLAEIYLNYAEAAIESGKGDALLAKTYLNAIRHRAAHTDQIPATIPNIMKERRIELAFEGHRYWDLVRRREYDKLFNASKRKSLVPILDLRQPTPQYIFVRSYNYYDQNSGGITFATKSYYKGIPGVATNKLVQNPQY
jgi:starch-binding outer membrane protein, SusD/RagB family